MKVEFSLLKICSSDVLFCNCKLVCFVSFDDIVMLTEIARKFRSKTMYRITTESVFPIVADWIYTRNSSENPDSVDRSHTVSTTPPIHRINPTGSFQSSPIRLYFFNVEKHQSVERNTKKFRSLRVISLFNVTINISFKRYKLFLFAKIRASSRY